MGTLRTWQTQRPRVLRPGAAWIASLAALGACAGAAGGPRSAPSVAPHPRPAAATPATTAIATPPTAPVAPASAQAASASPVSPATPASTADLAVPGPAAPASGAGAAPATGPDVPTRVLLMRVPQMPFDQFRNAVMGPAGIRLCRTPLLRSGTEEDITRHQTCQSYAAAQIDEALYLRTIRPAFGTFHGRMGEALTPPNCQMRNAHEQVCSSSVDGPAGVRWIVDRTGGQHRVVEVTQWSVNDG